MFLNGSVTPSFHFLFRYANEDEWVAIEHYMNECACFVDKGRPVITFGNVTVLPRLIVAEVVIQLESYSAGRWFGVVGGFQIISQVDVALIMQRGPDFMVQLLCH